MTGLSFTNRLLPQILREIVRFNTLQIQFRHRKGQSSEVSGEDESGKK